jgi:hypothetical protein
MSTTAINSPSLSTNEIVSFSAIANARRYEKTENVSSLVDSIREKRRPQPETSPASPILQNALAERSKAKLLANEMELIELRKLLDARKGEVPGPAVSPILIQLGYKPEGENQLLQKLEALVVKKEGECDKARKLVAEARKKRGSTPRNPESSSKSKTKKSATRVV